jgi:hypothetical protein
VLRGGTAAAAVATLAPLTVLHGAPASAAPASAAPGRQDGRIPLVRSRAAGIRSAETSLAVRGTGQAPWTSEAMSTDEFALLGFSWPAHAPTPTVEVRVRTGGAWQDWRLLPILDDRPDAGGGEATLHHATQPLWVGSADGVRVRVSGNRPARVTMSLIRPDTLAADTAPALDQPVAARRTTAAAAGEAPQPTVRPRTAWNADERWRDGRASYNDTILQVHVHHTVNANDYTRAETAGLIRGMYYYHTHTLGWSDLGYNFLVDRFGRIWEGRGGGITRAVRGAHTLGFNTTSCGVSVIGNFEEGRPSEAVVAAVAQVAAWKLGAYGRDPLGTVRVLSEGSDKFSRNARVTLPVIDGHRDTNDTACPGSLLYARLGDIRRAAAAILAGAAGPVVTATAPPVVTGEPTPGATLVVTPGTFTPATATASYAWLRDGVPIRKATRATRVVAAADAGHVLSVVVTLSAEGHEPVTQRVDLPEPVRHEPVLDVAVTGKPVAASGGAAERLTVAVTVAAGAVAEPGGTVTIRVDGGAKTVPVVAGRAVARFRRKTGEHVVRVGYSGTELVRPGTAQTSFPLPAPR